MAMHLWSGGCNVSFTQTHTVPVHMTALQHRHLCLQKRPRAQLIMRSLLLVLTWYAMSSALSLYNKKVIGKKYGVLGGEPFPAPMLMSASQFAMQHVLARTAHALGVRRTISALHPSVF